MLSNILETGKLLILRYGGIELEDSAAIGDYAMKRKGAVLDLSVSPRQPYAKVCLCGR